jgi:hypothetical protein
LKDLACSPVSSCFSFTNLLFVPTLSSSSWASSCTSFDKFPICCDFEAQFRAPSSFFSISILNFLLNLVSSPAQFWTFCSIEFLLQLNSGSSAQSSFFSRSILDHLLNPVSSPGQFLIIYSIQFLLWLNSSVIFCFSSSAEDFVEVCDLKAPHAEAQQFFCAQILLFLLSLQLILLVPFFSSNPSYSSSLIRLAYKLLEKLEASANNICSSNGGE